MATFNSKVHVVSWLRGILPSLRNEFGMLPSIKSLASMKGCCIATMQKAIKELEEDGFLLSKHGFGTCLRNSNSNIDFGTKHEKQDILNTISANKIKQKIVLILPVNNIIKPHLNNIYPYLWGFCQGVSEACEKLNIEVVIRHFDENMDNRNNSKKSILSFIKKNNITAIMTCSVVGNDLYRALSNLKLPCLIVDHWSVGSQLPNFNPNHYEATKEVVFILASLKHKRIALIDQKNNERNPYILNGYKSGMIDAQLEINESLLFNVKANFLVNRKEDHLINFEKFLQSKNRPTAFITYGSEVAVELIKIFERLNLKVPRDVSIIAFCSNQVEINGKVLSGIFVSSN